MAVDLTAIYNSTRENLPDKGTFTYLLGKEDIKKLPQERPKIDYLDRVHFLPTTIPSVARADYGIRSEKDSKSLISLVATSFPTLSLYGVSPIPDRTSYRPVVAGYDFKPEQYR